MPDDADLEVVDIDEGTEPEEIAAELAKHIEPTPGSPPEKEMAAPAEKVAQAPAEPEEGLDPDEDESFGEQPPKVRAAFARTKRELRETRQALERQQLAAERSAQLLQAIYERQAAVEQRLVAATTPPPPPRPRFEEDPEGFIDTRLEQIEQRIEQTEEQRRVAYEQELVDDANEEQRDFIREDTAAAESKYPDYKEASLYLAQQDFAAFKFQNPGRTDQEIYNFMLYAWVPAIQRQYAESGASLGEAVYQRALAAGYQPKNGGAEGGEPEGAAPAAGQSPDPRVERVRQRVAAQGLSAAGKAAETGKKVDWNAALGSMDDDEFADLLDEINHTQLRTLAERVGAGKRAVL